MGSSGVNLSKLFVARPLTVNGVAPDAGGNIPVASTAGGTVTSVVAGDASITVGGSPDSAPTIAVTPGIYVGLDPMGQVRGPENYRPLTIDTLSGGQVVYADRFHRSNRNLHSDHAPTGQKYTGSGVILNNRYWRGLNTQLATLSGPVTIAGGSITALPVTALAADIPAGTLQLQTVGSPSLTQPAMGTWVVTTTGASAGATSIPITGAIPVYDFAAGDLVTDTTYGPTGYTSLDLPTLATQISAVGVTFQVCPGQVGDINGGQNVCIAFPSTPGALGNGALQLCSWVAGWKLFTTTNVGGQVVFTTLASGAYAAPLVADGITHHAIRIAADLPGSAITFGLPDGSTQRYTGPEVASWLGSNLTVQMRHQNATDGELIITGVIVSAIPAAAPASQLPPIGAAIRLGKAGAFYSTPAPTWTPNDLDMQAIVAVDSFTPANGLPIISQWSSSGSQYSWYFEVTTTGALRCAVSPDGVTINSATSSGSLSSVAQAGQLLCVRATVAASTGVVTFYTAPVIFSATGVASFGAWTQLGTTEAVTPGVPFASTAPIQVGRQDTSFYFAGLILYAGVLNGIGGNEVAAVDLRTLWTGTDAEGNLWTLNGAASTAFQPTLGGVVGLPQAFAALGQPPAPAVVVAGPLNPAGTVSTSAVMAGLGVTFTPKTTGHVLMRITGSCGTQTGVSFVGLKGYYGTGTAPANGAAVTGTAFVQGLVSIEAAVAGASNRVQGVLVSPAALAAGTTYWLDFSFYTGNGADQADVSSVMVEIMEYTPA